jgi:hypothetical protein
MFTTDELENRILKRIPFELLAASAVLALSLALLRGWVTGVFVFAGGVVSTLGFIGLKSALSRILQPGRKGTLRSFLLVYGARFALILAFFLIIIFWFPRKILAFVAGFSTLVPVFLYEGAAAIWRMKSWKS